jgi:hypothetical protein
VNRANILVTSLFTCSFITTIVSAPASVRAQTDTVSPAGIALGSAVSAAVMFGALYQNYTDFWKSADRVPFHFSNDPPYAMHNDKFGHAYYTYMSSDLIKIAFREGGMNSKTAAWIGAGVAMLAQTMVEIGDGFRGYDTAYFGFSPGDEISNILGAALSVGKEYLPALRRVDYKMGFWPSSAYQAGVYQSIFDDDESRFYWISFAVGDLLIDGYPKWLNLAVGHGAANLPPASYIPQRVGKKPESLLFIGPDLNFKGLPIEGKAWSVIAEILDHIRIPLPALQVSPQVKWHWLKP